MSDDFNGLDDLLDEDEEYVDPQKIEDNLDSDDDLGILEEDFGDLEGDFDDDEEDEQEDTAEDEEQD